jgi:hypothetical protein
MAGRIAVISLPLVNAARLRWLAQTANHANSIGPTQAGLKCKSVKRDLPPSIYPRIYPIPTSPSLASPSLPSSRPGLYSASQSNWITG